MNVELAPTGYTLVLVYENEMEKVVGDLLDQKHLVHFFTSHGLANAEQPPQAMEADGSVPIGRSGRRMTRDFMIDKIRRGGPCALVLPRGVPIAHCEWMACAERAYVFHENKFYCVKNREAPPESFEDIYGL